jgi:hypothetical protein
MNYMLYDIPEERDEDLALNEGSGAVNHLSPNSSKLSAANSSSNEEVLKL